MLLVVKSMVVKVVKQLAVSMLTEGFGQSQGSWSVEEEAIIQFMKAPV